MSIQIGDFTLHDFQETAIDDCRLKMNRGATWVVLQAPTGAGKTIMALRLIQLVLERGKRVGFITSGRQLIFQMADRMLRAGLPFSVLMNAAGDDLNYNAVAQVQIISKDTLIARIDKLAYLEPHMYIVDEADLCLSPIWLDILAKAKFVIGLTATPITAEGHGLGEHYHAMVQAGNYETLTQAGIMTPIKCFSPYRPDLTGAVIRSGEYAEDWLNQRLNRTSIVGKVVEHWRKYGENRPTVAFACGVAHSRRIAEEFNGAGIPATHIDASTDQDDREQAFSDLRAGRINVVSNCAVLTRGWDEPCISCGILAKPTRRLRTFLQMSGRLIRSFPGKKDAILIDHSGAVWAHGWPTEDREWPLDSGLDKDSEQKERKPRDLRYCPNCAAIWISGNSCPSCNYQKKVGRSQPTETVDGKLVAVKRSRGKSKQSTKQQLWLSILAKMAYTGYTYSTASSIFHKHTQQWPEQAGVTPRAEPTQRHRKVSVLWPGFIRRKKVNA